METTPPAGPADTRLRQEALRRIAARRALQAHVIGYVALNVILIAIWAVSEYQNAGGWPTGLRSGRRDHDWDPWVVYPLIGTTVGLAIHWWATAWRRAPTEREIARAMGELRDERP
ncbi:MAG: 2TM domain-containing protein [Thermoleophilia bacterium]|nr:2TM domain-containing protein [Thermoleophilia bacterium]